MSNNFLTPQKFSENSAQVVDSSPVKIFDSNLLAHFFRELAVFILAVVSIGGISLGILGLVRDRVPAQSRDQAIWTKSDEAKLEATEKKVDDDEAEFERQIVAELNELKNRPAGNGMSLADREALRQAIDEQKKLTERISVLEGALINEPAKALAVPLLKKDVDDLADREKSNAAAVHAQDDRLDKLVNQILYITFGILSAIGLAISYFSYRNKTSPTTSVKS